MFEYKTCLYFPKSTNNKGLEQAKEHLRINELPALYNKALEDWVWLPFVTAQEFSSWNAVAPRRHLYQGIKRNWAPRSSWFYSHTRRNHSNKYFCSWEAFNRWNTRADDPWGYCRWSWVPKREGDASEQLCQGRLPCSAVCSSAPTAALAPPSLESSVHHNELLFHQLPEPSSSSLPLIHWETTLLATSERSYCLQNLLWSATDALQQHRSNLASPVCPAQQQSPIPW